MKLNAKSLNHIHQQALYRYKNTAAKKDQDSAEFLTECWAIALLEEMKKVGLTDLVYEVDEVTQYRSHEDE